jgi:hypothetical protein
VRRIFDVLPDIPLVLADEPDRDEQERIRFDWRCKWKRLSVALYDIFSCGASMTNPTLRGFGEARGKQ